MEIVHFPWRHQTMKSSLLVIDTEVCQSFYTSDTNMKRYLYETK